MEMDNGAGMEFLAVAPEMIVLVGAIAAILSGSFLRRDRQWISRVIAIAALLSSAALAGLAFAQPVRTVFEGSFAVDVGTNAARLIICLATVLVIVLGVEELTAGPQESETYALMLLSALGAMVMSGTSDLLILAVGFLLASIPLYALIGMNRSATGAEAAMKTYLLGAFSGIALLLGVTLLYALAGGTAYATLQAELADMPAGVIALGLVGVLTGLVFKAGAVPAHFWVPDAAQGSTVSAAAFLTTVPKIGALVAIYRLLLVIPPSVNWPLLIGLLAAASMTLGNFAAFTQSDARRLLGWSTVSQAGYLLLPVAVAGLADLALPSLLLYLAGYAVTNLGAFAVIAATGRTPLEKYRGLARENPWLSVALVVSLLSLVGTPPTAVFFGKLTTFTAAWDGGLAWLVAIAAINTVASLFYYLRWIVPAFQRTSAPAAGQAISPQPRRWATQSAYAAAVVVIVMGTLSGLLLPLFEGPLIR
ncbi:NADH-quinone oxidoreductase subunit N [uncultured Arthrobacter sp.]|uniref:NADH-quinone oxidoreductase subunit N n=1 Tax=uncultured Arthrobacter sp. TaxID=114050 RepID=UPI002630C096|nr:NADH-quinone oxidoreductase subunit N [uncultured Arthrobacter sp.]